MRKKDFKPSKEAQEKFNKLSTAQKIAAISRRMEAGDSNIDAAMALGATPGQIAGIRYKHKIPSRNEPPGLRATHKRGGKKEEKSARKSEPPRVKLAVPVSIPEPVPEAPKPKLVLPEPPDKPKPPYKLAVSRFTSCEAKWEDDRLCDYEREEKSKFCKLHNWMRKHPRT
jgi:hypothetical protein